ncbi:MAG: lipid-A-disaccharide synthase [bacterium]
MRPEIFIVTGEASGDVYGAMLAGAIRAARPGITISGVGGERMRAAGVEIFLDSGNLSVVGFWEAVVRLRELRGAMNEMKAYIARERPDLVILIDYPGMNLRLARFAKERGIKVMYYISPQVWAWGRGRVRSIRKYVDKMVVILPFELDLYRREGVDVEYVGHPLIDVVKTGLEPGAFRRTYGIGPDSKLVSLLPGSRLQEIGHHLTPLLEAARELGTRISDAEFVVVGVPEYRDRIEAELERLGLDYPIVGEHKYDAIADSDLALTCSGTVTLEAALLGTPMIVIYRLSLVSWILGRIVVRVPYISLANLVAGHGVVPELIQGSVTRDQLVRESMRILEDENLSGRMRKALSEVRSKLGEGGATERAAEIAVSLASH